MLEIRGSFSTAEEWLAWLDSLGEIEPLRSGVLRDIRSRGFIEPWTGAARLPHDISIVESDLQNSICSHELNSRRRALLLQVMLEFQARNWLERCDIRILATGALSRVAMILRGTYPLSLATEFLPDEAAREEYFPVTHLDLQRIEYPDESFDAFAIGNVFERIPDLDLALQELYRVMKPGGLLVSSVHFDPNRLTTLVRATVSATGEVIRHDDDPSEAHSADSQATPTFQIPGWDFLTKLVDYGFEDAYFSMIASSHFGVLASSELGPFLLSASKPGGKLKPGIRPSNIGIKTALPDKLCALIALPRSGTTMLTSVFAVHSKCEAVYEPWNGKRVSGDAQSRLEVISRVEDLPDLSGKMLFVKETAAFQGSIPGLRKLYDTTPIPVEKYMLMLLRQPEHTFLSEIERRKEWWKDDVTVNAATFDGWAEKSLLAIRLMLDFGKATDGTIVLLEDFAAQPALLLGQLAQRIGFAVEPQQLEYEKHVDKRRIRGDLNVSKNPSKIDVSLALTRGDASDRIVQLVQASSHSSWFMSLRSLYAVIHEAGGIMSIRKIPKTVLDAL